MGLDGIYGALNGAGDVGLELPLKRGQAGKSFALGADDVFGRKLVERKRKHIGAAARTAANRTRPQQFVQAAFH
jgi:hypothetical protein